METDNIHQKKKKKMETDNKFTYKYPRKHNVEVFTSIMKLKESSMRHQRIGYCIMDIKKRSIRFAFQKSFSFVLGNKILLYWSYSVGHTRNRQ